MTFGQYYRGIVLRPTATLTSLMADDRRLRFGLMALGINVVLYTWVYVNLTIGGGAPSAFEPWLAIPKEVYYFYNQFILAPSMVGCWILSAGVIQLASKPFGGRGTFEGTLAGLGFAISIACLASLAHDLPDTFLGAIGLLDLKAYEVALNTPTIWRTILWTCYVSSFVLFFFLFWKVTRVVQQIRNGPAFVIGSTAFVIYQVTFLVFNR
ncbi:MAG: hypothetical protein MUE68_12465 [Bacteroidetes bacterium]|jgi:hypothetical protein|nr:hypothetical protein [Bacteroidota bacterium]